MQGFLGPQLLAMLDNVVAIVVLQKFDAELIGPWC